MSFQSTKIARCSTIRNILSCCGKCASCCSVIGLPFKREGHLKGNSQCYWMIWLIIAFILLFSLGYGITLLFNNKSSNKIYKQLSTNNTSLLVQNKQSKQSIIIQPIISTDKPIKTLIVNKTQQLVQPIKKQQQPIPQPDPIVQKKIVQPIIQNKIVQPIVSTDIYRPKITQEQILVKPQYQKPQVIFVPIQTHPHVIQVIKQKFKVIKEKPEIKKQQITFQPLPLNQTRQKLTKSIITNKQKSIQKHTKRNNSISSTVQKIKKTNISTIKIKNQTNNKQKQSKVNQFTSSISSSKNMNNSLKQQVIKTNKSNKSSLIKKETQKIKKNKHINRLPHTKKSQYQTIRKKHKNNNIIHKK